MAIKSYNDFPYVDDYLVSDPNFDGKNAYEKGYLRILFAPGKSVQVRELNQLQTILQNQIDKFGSSIYKDGTPVIDGLATWNNNLFYIDILLENPVLINAETSTVILEYVEQIIEIENRKEGETLLGGIKATVIGYEKTAVANTYRFFIKYNSAIQEAGANVTEYAIVDENIVILDDIVNTAGDAVLTAGSTVGHVTGKGYAASATVNEGVYFIKGSFVHTPYQNKFFSKPSKDYILNGKVSFLVSENIKTYNDDLSLLDNANGTPNYTAPGADRYAVTLSIVFISQNKNSNDAQFISDHTYVYDENTLPNLNSFVTLIQIIESRNVLPARTELSELGDILAKRTYEESGNYIVDPFVVTISEYLNDEAGNNGIYTAEKIRDADEGDAITTIQEAVEYGNARVVATVEPAIAYVDGYRVELIDKINIPILKARTEETHHIGITAKYGNYVEGTLNLGLPDIHDNSVVYAISGSTETCRIRYISKINATTWRLYLYDVSGEIPATATISLGSEFSFDYTGGLQDTSNTKTAFKLPFDTANSIANLEITEILDFDSTVTGLTVDIQIPVGRLNTNFESTNPNDYLVKNDTTHAVYTVTNVEINPTPTTGGTTVRLTLDAGDSPTGTVKVLAPVETILEAPENKTINSGTQQLVFGPGDTKLALTFYDVFKVTDIKQSGTSILGPGESPLDYITLDNGQRDGIYKPAEIKRINLADGTYDFEFDYFVHSGTGNYFSVDSYTDEAFAKGLSYKGTRMTDYLDFRSKIGDPTVIVKAGSLIEADVTYYLPQINQLIVNTLGEVSIVYGTPAMEPILPKTPNASMALYNLYFPAYTFKASDIRKTYLDNKVYTMHDIAKLDKRLTNVEEVLALSLLEKAASEQTFFNENDGSVRFKNGFIVDPFKGHSIGNVFDAGYSAAIDDDKGILRPAFDQYNIPLKLEGATKDLITLPYTEEELIKQSLASESANLNPYDLANWNGVMKLSPSSDEWYETRRRPDIIVNLDGSVDAIEFLKKEADAIGTKWRCWKTNWLGESSRNSGNDKAKERPKTIEDASGETRVSSSTETLSKNPADKIRDNLKSTLEIKNIKKNLGDRIVDTNFIPYIRSRKVYFKAEMLKPNTKMYAFFDDEDVTSFATKATFVPYRDTDEVEDFINQDDPIPVGEKVDLVTDANGVLEGYFIIPNYDVLKFKTGVRKFKLTDSPINDNNSTNTFAVQKYSAKGLLLTKETTILSTREAYISSERIDVTRNVVKDETSTSVTYRDPIAQSFVIGNIDSGIYSTSVDVFFASKSEKVPMELHLVSVENGIPTQKIVPFSSVVKYPADITTSLDGSVATTFTFEEPIFLQPGVEYAIVLLSNSPDYKVYVSALGGIDLITQNRIAKNPYAGVFFKSQNASTWTPDQTRDLKFTLRKARYTSLSQTSTLKPIFDNPVTPIVASSFNIIAESTKHPTSTVDFDMIVGNNSGGVIYDLNEEEFITLNNEITINNDTVTPGGLRVIADISSSINTVSPVIDLDRLSLLAIKNKINNDSTGETNSYHGNALSKYITREINLNDPADRVNITFALNLPTAETAVEVYVRIKYGDDSSINDNDWVLITPDNELQVNSDGSFEDVTYEYDPVELFNSFQVKIVMLSSNPARVPQIKEFRAIATI